MVWKCKKNSKNTFFGHWNIANYEKCIKIGTNTKPGVFPQPKIKIRIGKHISEQTIYVLPENRKKFEKKIFVVNWSDAHLTS